jgi:hypothetical protein
MMLRASVRRRKAHEPTPLLAKEGICGTYRMENLWKRDRWEERCWVKGKR